MVTIHIRLTEETNALNKNEIISAAFSETANADSKAEATTRIPTNKKKPVYHAPGGPTHWNESGKDLVGVVNVNATPRKRRSLLSNMSFAYSSDESSNSEEDGEEGANDDNHEFCKLNTADKGKRHSSLSKKPPVCVYSTIPPSKVPIKKLHWIKGLFYKQAKSELALSSAPSSSSSLTRRKMSTVNTTPFEPASPQLTNKAVIISNFFSKKRQPKDKAKPKEAKPIPKLPKRYPIPIERVIYEISWMKLNNPQRPLSQHVSIFNMLAWYTDKTGR